MPTAQRTAVKAASKSLMVEAWDDRWRNHCPKEQRCRQTKAFFPALNTRLANEIILCKRSVLSKIILIISGEFFFILFKKMGYFVTLLEKNQVSSICKRTKIVGLKLRHIEKVELKVS